MGIYIYILDLELLFGTNQCWLYSIVHILFSNYYSKSEKRLFKQHCSYIVLELLLRTPKSVIYTALYIYNNFGVTSPSQRKAFYVALYIYYFRMLQNIYTLQCLGSEYFFQNNLYNTVKITLFLVRSNNAKVIMIPSKNMLIFIRKLPPLCYPILYIMRCQNESAYKWKTLMN